MSRSTSLALRFTAVVAALALLHVILSSGVPANSPYRSALADLPALALAAAHCPDKTCASVSGGGCVGSAGNFCGKSGGQCFTRGC